MTDGSGGDEGPARTWSVRELATTIGDRLRDAFPTEVWVRGEIRDLARARSGHVYFTLVDDEDGSQAALSVILTAAAKTRVNRLLTRTGGNVRMTDGTEVRIRGRLDFYGPRGQLQLQMRSIDPAFTLGQLAAARAELLETLRQEGLLEANAELPVPFPPLRIGLVTSAGSAAEADVLDELRRSGFRFEIDAVDVRVQGADAPTAVAGAIVALCRRSVDVILLARGGGAATDLAAFDAEVVARTIARSTVPVLTGIGHETDRSLADEVAHTAAKTPTAAARVLVTWVGEALACAEEAWSSVAAVADRRLEAAQHEVDRSAARIGSATDRVLGLAVDRLDSIGHRVGERAVERCAGAERLLGGLARRVSLAGTSGVSLASSRLDVLATRVSSADPAAMLARGWAIVRGPDGTVVRSAGTVDVGHALRITLADGRVGAEVTDVDPAVPDPEDRR